MSARENYTGVHVRSLSPLHRDERGTPSQFKLFLWDVAAVFSALLLISATGVGIAFAALVLFFGHF